MKTSTAIGLLLLLPFAAVAQEVGRELNFETPSSPNYRELELPEEPEFVLPPVQTPALPTPRVSGGVSIFVSEIRVEGVTALAPDEVAAVTAPYENRQVTSGELQTLRLELSKLYVDSGFVSSGVLLPDQEVVDGVVVYQAVEGRLEEIELVGEHHLRDSYVSGRIARRVEDPLDVNEVQDALRHLQRDPNVERLDARMRPGTSPGSTVLSVGLDESPRFFFGAGSNNHRATSTGGERAYVTGGWRNLTGFGEQFRGTLGISDGADEAAAVLTVPITARNDTIQAYYSRTDSDIVEQRFDDLNITSDTDTVGVLLNIPIVDTLTDQFSLALGVEVVDSDTELDGEPFSFSPGADNGETKTAPAMFGLDWVHRTNNTVTGVRATYRRGIDWLDATIYERDLDDPVCGLQGLGFDPCNPAGADGEFDVLQTQLLFIQRLAGINDRAQLILRSTGQFSQDALFSQEKLAIGGVNTVRGYPENTLVRDNGVTATVEVQLPVFGYQAEPNPRNLVVAPFSDYGISWDEEDTSPGSVDRDSSKKRWIASLGLGLLWNPLEGLNAQVYWGADIADNFNNDDPRDLRDDTDLQDDGVHFSLSYVARF